MLASLNSFNNSFLCLEVSTDFIYSEKINELDINGEEKYTSVFKKIIHPSTKFREGLLTFALGKSFKKDERYPHILLGLGPGSFTMLKLAFAYLKTYILLSAANLYLYPSFWFWYRYLDIKKDGVLCIRLNRRNFYLIRLKSETSFDYISKYFSEEELLSLIEKKLFLGKKIKQFYVWNSSFPRTCLNEELFLRLHEEKKIHLITKQEILASKFSMLPFFSKEQLEKWKTPLNHAIPFYGEHTNFIKKI